MRGRRGKRDFVKESFFLFGGGKVFGLKSGRRENHVRQRGAFLWAVIFLNSFFRPFRYGIKKRICRSTTLFSCSILIMIFFNVIRRCETTAYNYDCFPTHTIDSTFFFFLFLTSWITALCSRFLPFTGMHRNDESALRVITLGSFVVFQFPGFCICPRRFLDFQLNESVYVFLVTIFMIVIVIYRLLSFWWKTIVS